MSKKLDIRFIKLDFQNVILAPIKTVFGIRLGVKQLCLEGMEGG